jgi:hypothetical protein
LALAACSAFSGQDATADVPDGSADSGLGPDGQVIGADAAADATMVDPTSAFPLPKAPFTCKDYLGQSSFCDDFEPVLALNQGFMNRTGGGTISIAQANGSSVLNVTVVTSGDAKMWPTYLLETLTEGADKDAVMLDFDFRVVEQSLSYITVGYLQFANAADRVALGVGGYPNILGQLERPDLSVHTVMDMSAWHHVRALMSMKAGAGITTIDGTVVQERMHMPPHIQPQVIVGVASAGEAGAGGATGTQTTVQIDNVLVREH